jgi:hypothetical protein
MDVVAPRLLWMGVGARAPSKSWNVVAAHAVPPRSSAAPQAEDFEATAKQVFASAGWAQLVASGRRRLQLTVGGGAIFCVELDEAGGRAYLAAASSSYPSRYLFAPDRGAPANSPRLLGELRDFCDESASAGSAEMAPAAAEFKALRSALLPFMRGALAQKFGDVEQIDKLAQVRRKVADVQRVMADNLTRASGERDALLAGLEDKTAQLEKSAQLFSDGATELRNWAWRRKWCAYAGIGGVAVALVVTLVLSLNYFQRVHTPSLEPRPLEPLAPPTLLPDLLTNSLQHNLGQFVPPIVRFHWW